VTSLKGYIDKFGEAEGPIKYKERCQKISKSQSADWYIDKFGEEEGLKRYNHKIEKTRKSCLGKSVSNRSKLIGKLLTKVDINFISEYVFRNHKSRIFKRLRNISFI